jgi:general secretion pathway protein A
VKHRLRVAGTQSDVFTKGAIRTLYRRSRGIPRLINVIADRALLAAYTQDRRSVDAKLVSAAAAEVFGGRRKTPWWPVTTATAGVAAIAFGVTNLGNPPPGAPHAPEPFLSAAPAQGSAPVVDLPLETLAAPVEATSDSHGADSGAPPTAVAAERPPLTLPSLLADPQFVVSTEQAIGELLALWGAHYDAARGEPCVQAQEQGLLCLFQRRGSLGELRRVNWPTILSLVTADGAEHPVVIAALGYDHAELTANGKSFKLPLVELSFHWYGDHLLLWRPGDAPGGRLTPGVDDAGVRWLRGTVAKLDGEPVAFDGSTFYDDELERRVRAFQREHQLAVDGIVGARTQVAMLAKLGLADAPSLRVDH